VEDRAHPLVIAPGSKQVVALKVPSNALPLAARSLFIALENIMSMHVHTSRRCALAGLISLATLCECAAQPGKASNSAALDGATALSYPSVDAEIGEQLYRDEQALAHEIAVVIEQSIRDEYRPGHARRDAHPKAHGCVTAEFHVLDALPKHLSAGVFVPGQTYQALIRFSNGSKDARRADRKGDARGMAIKLLGVAGDKLLEHERDATTQDFILISHPVFFANDPSRYLSVVTRAASDSTLQKALIPVHLGLKGAVIALKTTRKKISNPLQTRYWSTVPYQLGLGPNRQAVKYSARSCSPTTDPIPDHAGNDFLRDALRTTLQAGDACMEFLVQPRSRDGMSVEDSMTEWKESEAPFRAKRSTRPIRTRPVKTSPSIRGTRCRSTNHWASRIGCAR
jgi:Catalase